MKFVIDLPTLDLPPLDWEWNSFNSILVRIEKEKEECVNKGTQATQRVSTATQGILTPNKSSNFNNSHPKRAESNI